ncbi:MAG: long-chain fatty acid--CoA ligase [Acidobacteriia bacterium]|nr:long-chain fatty acid--CoA ligase [Terriglobia bacterium]
MNFSTLNELFLEATSAHQKPDVFMYKSEGAYHALSTQEVRQAVEEFALGLMELGVVAGDRVALLSENRPGWAIADYAILGIGAVNVPIYPTLPPKQIQYILEDCGAKALIVSTGGQLEKAQEIRGSLPGLTSWVILDELVPSDTRIKTYSQVCAVGGERRRREPNLFLEKSKAVKSEDLASLIYTSGTTGNPKGVMLSHKNIASNIRWCGDLVDLSSKDIALCLLPLCHVYERVLDYVYFYFGVSIAYAESFDAVGVNLTEVRPTVMACVPRLYEKVYIRMQETAAQGSSLKKKIFRWAVATGREWGRLTLAHKPVGAWLQRKYHLADHLVFSKLRARMGGRLRFFISGGAPLAKELAEFFYAAGIMILEGYGLSETSPVITMNRLDHFKFGTVGLPIPHVEMKLAPDGEILTRSDCVMLGYYHRPAETTEAMAGGWFHTGDIGLLDDEGFLRITDRKKDIIVTSGGKNVAPQNIENLLKTCNVVQNIMVVGNRRNFISALVVPNFEKIEAFARSAGLTFQTRAQLIESPEIQNYVFREITAATTDLAPFERIKKIALLPEDFTVASGELTPTLKVKRNVVEERYKSVIDQMYQAPGQ